MTITQRQAATYTHEFYSHLFKLRRTSEAAVTYVYDPNATQL